MRTYYRLEMVCEQLELSHAQLRRYERVGLIVPSGRPEHQHGHPCYTEQDLQRIRRIRRLQRDLGLNLASLQVVMHMRDQIEELQRRLEEQIGRGST